MKRIFFLLAMVACGGQTIGDLDGGTDSGKSDTGTSKTCAKDSDCGKGICGFPIADACSAKGQCFGEPGPLCNGFFPGCACDGTTINIGCSGLPDGYVTAPLVHKGQCSSAIDGGGGYLCDKVSCVPGQDICYLSANPVTGTCMPANGCTDCNCAKAMFQCISSCKQSGDEIYIQCQ